MRSVRRRASCAVCCVLHSRCRYTEARCSSMSSRMSSVSNSTYLSAIWPHAWQRLSLVDDARTSRTAVVTSSPHSTQTPRVDTIAARRGVAVHVAALASSPQVADGR
eukprot:7382770-Prymnesium_polylepis.1